MTETAVFPGSFDPITLGHVDIVTRAARLFDKIYVAIGTNTSKQYLSPFESRKRMVEEAFVSVPGVEVVAYNELTVSLCKRLGARYLVRGLRSSTDFDYERNIALMNQALWPEVETVFFISRPELSGITSTIVREIYRYGGDISSFVPHAVMEHLLPRPPQA